jgi:hypothetical protein
MEDVAEPAGLLAVMVTEEPVDGAV